MNNSYYVSCFKCKSKDLNVFVNEHNQFEFVCAKCSYEIMGMPASKEMLELMLLSEQV